jgi:hypothetical protein
VTRGGSPPPPTEPTVATRLEGETEPFPYTKVRDWIVLLPQADLSDGAFRLYYVSRSVIWENAKGGPPPRPVIEITYEEYAMILGRSARTISRLAEDLFRTGLWEEVERTHRSVKVPGQKRPEVRTVVTVKVHDYPAEPWSWDGPVKTWDVLSQIRETKREAQEARVAAANARTATQIDSAQCVATESDVQADQAEHPFRDEADPFADDEADSADSADASGCDRTDLSPQEDEGPQAEAGQDHQEVAWPGQTPPTAGGPGPTKLSEPQTNLSTDSDVSAGQTGCEWSLKKNEEKEEPPSLPPAPSGDTRRESLTDELAMFSAETVDLVARLYDKTLTSPGLQPLSSADRAGLARRIDSRLTEGWSLARIRAVLTGGSLVGVKMPGRLWIGRLDDMPAFPNVPNQRSASPEDRTPPETARRAADRRQRTTARSNDCSVLADPNPGKCRYEVPDDRGLRMAVRWADSRRVLAWCGRCSCDSRCLRPRQPGSLLQPCPECHPEPDAFPAPAPEADTPMAHAAATDAG